MKTREARAFRYLTAWIVIGVAVSAATLAWLGHTAVRQWQNSAATVARQRATTALDLTITAMMRDMRAVQEEIAAWRWAEADHIRDLVANTFARYPYPAWFFSWRGEARPQAVVFFGRPDRLPAWFLPEVSPSRFTVAIGTGPETAALLVSRIARSTLSERDFVIFDLDLAGNRHQIVTRFVHSDQYREHLAGAFGFAVDLQWAREHYFPEIISEISRIGGGSSGLLTTLVDTTGTVVVGTLGQQTELVSRRSFPILFFDPLLATLDAPPDLNRDIWSLAISAGNDPTLHAVSRGARQTLAIAATSAVVLTLGLLLVSRALRARADLVETRAELVSSVTHELKTPLASIRAAAETLVSGRVADTQGVRDYARLLVEQSVRLTRLVDNLLAYARITDVTDAYSFEPVPVGELVDEAIRDFSVQLSAARFDVDINIPMELPPVLVDSAAIGLLLDNLIDNAIRYSTTNRRLRISAHQEHDRIVLEIRDRGIGIGAAEIHHVTEKFFRGRRATPGGSGLGLAIAQRIVAGHRGSLAIQSTVDVGTTVSVRLPSAVRRMTTNEAADSCS